MPYIYWQTQQNVQVEFCSTILTKTKSLQEFHTVTACFKYMYLPACSSISHVSVTCKPSQYHDIVHPLVMTNKSLIGNILRRVDACLIYLERKTSQDVFAFDISQYIVVTRVTYQAYYHNSLRQIPNQNITMPV